MTADNFSHKEILIQVIAKLDNLAVAVSKQELLLNSIYEASAARDEKILELRNKVIILEDTVVVLSEKIEALKSFNKTLLAIWSGFILLVSIFGRDLINKVF